MQRRLEWLRKSADGYRPGPYNQLADAYRRAGHVDDARAVLIGKERERAHSERDLMIRDVQEVRDASRSGQGPNATMRWHRWALLRVRIAVQRRFAGGWDWFVRYTVGYGYQPLRITYWALALWVVATGAVAMWGDSIESKTSGSSKAHLYPEWYALDLLLPVANLKQRDLFVVHGWPAVTVTTLFVVAGWIFALVLVAGLTGLFKRD